MTSPPRLARTLVRKLAPPDLADDLLDELDEAYRREVRRTGAASARRWYWRQALGSVRPLTGMGRARRRHAVGARPHLSPAIRQGVRRFTASPAFAASAVATLSLAFAANLTIFALIDGVLLRPLPYRDADRIVDVGHRAPGLGVESAGQSQGAWFWYREAAQSFESIGIYNSNHVNLTGGDSADRAPIAMISHEVFDALGVEPLLGHFGVDDDGPETPPTVMLSWGLWQRRYGGEPDIIGQTVGINGNPREVIAVMPRGFAFPTADTQLWMRQGFDPDEARFGDLAYGSVAKLRPGVTAAEAEAELNTLIPRLPALYADARPDWLRDSGLAARVEPLRDVVVAGADSPLMLTLAAAGLVMLLAGANVVNLFVIRAEQRQRDTGICRALGATSRHLLVSLLTESILVCALAAGIATRVATFVVDWIAGSAAGLLPRVETVAVSPRPIAVLTGLALVTAAGLATAGLWRSRHASLQAGPRGASASRDHARVRLGLVSAQVTLAFTLIAVSSLLVGSVWNLSRLDKGFDAANVLTFEIALPGRGYSGFAASAAYHAELTERLRALRFVADAGAVTDLPLSGFTIKPYLDSVVVVRSATGDDSEAHGVNWKLATPRYFHTMRIPVLAGRWPGSGESYGAGSPIAVSESFARRHLGGQPLGRQIRHAAASGWSTVISVVGDVTDDSLRQAPAEAVYVPVLDQDEAAPFVPLTMTHVLRSTVPSSVLFGAVRATVAALDSDVPIAALQTMTAIESHAMARDTLVLALVATAGGLAVLVGVVGLYGALAYSIAERRREIGVRMALGASRGRLRWEVARAPITALGLGLMAGTLGAASLAALFSDLLFQVRVVDVGPYAAAAAVLVVTAAIALGLSIRRLRTITPLEALRAE